MSPRGVSRWAATLLFAALVWACAVAPKLEAPRLSITDVQILSSDLLSQHMRVRMHAENPNDRALPVRRIEYTIEVDGEQVASGASLASFVVPPLGQAEFDLTFNTNLAAAALKVLGHGSGATGREIPYRLSGKVALAESWLWRSIPFDQRGSFRLQ